jgi:hypothetical protein
VLKTRRLQKCCYKIGLGISRVILKLVREWSVVL